MLAVKPFRQAEGQCGPASLHMVLAYYGIEATEKELARLSSSTRKHGVETYGLLRAARAYGVKGFVKDRASFSDLRAHVLKKGMPVIVDWFSTNDGHYSVVVHLDKKFIYLQDPEIRGIRKMSMETFRRVWFDFPGLYIKTPNDVLLRRMIVIYKEEPRRGKP